MYIMVARAPLVISAFLISFLVTKIDVSST